MVTLHKPTALENALKMSIGQPRIVKPSFGGRVKQAIFGIDTGKKKLTPLVSPLALAGRVGLLASVGKVLKGAWTGGRQALSTLGKMSLKERGVAIATTGTAIGLGSYAATGEVPKFSKRTIAGIAGLQLNPFGALAGGFSGLGKEGVQFVKQKFQETPIPFVNYSPYIPMQIPSAGGQQIQFPPSPSISIEMPQQPSLSLPSISISGGIAGAGTDLTPYLLALLAGGGGYLLGRKRRKRKKSRRKRRRKRA